MKANEMQVGGLHYKHAYLEHWDFVIQTGMRYLEAQATRYITRWRKKDGLQDLQKALHYINKMIENVNILRAPGAIRVGGSRPNLTALLDVAARFIRANELSDTEGLLVQDLTVWKDEVDLCRARDVLLELMNEADPPSVAKPVPLTEENHHAEREPWRNCLVREGRAVDAGGNTVYDCRFPNCDCPREDEPLQYDETGPVAPGRLKGREQ